MDDREPACRSFESAIPDFYLSHFDLTGRPETSLTGIGPSGLPILTDTFVRITRSPVASIAKIRGCVRGVSSEFVLACDMRFASRENTRSANPKSGWIASRRRRHRTSSTSSRPRPGARNHSRGERLRRRYRGAIRIRQPCTSRRRTGRLRRHARAPDRVLRPTCHRCSKKSRQPGLVAIRRPAPRRAHSFQTALTWTETQQRIEALLKRGLQQDSSFERRWPAVLGTLLET